jgi:alkylation response protein AidB-like acyl-CoA dehydrogenase
MTTLQALLEDLSSDLRDTLARVTQLADESFGPRADEIDRRGTFPKEHFEALASAGLLGATIPTSAGGLGLGMQHGRTFALWMMTKLMAKADLSLARCWEGHTNSLVLIDALGTPPQKQRWFTGVVERGEIWVAWSGEPSAPKPGERARFGTTVTATANGWIVNGTKAFATSASGANRAILLVNTEGPGGARHSQGSPEGLLMLACDLSDPSISIDTSWWDPVGMRATASHLIRFEQTFVPHDCLLGRPGSYLLDQWQAAFVPHYAASFLGAAEAACDYAVKYVNHQNKVSDPYIQHRIGSMAANVDGGHLWLHHVARLWDRGRRAEAALAGIRVRHVVEHLAEETVHHCIRACGARSLIRPSPIERILRDLTFYLRHDNDDHVLATIGRAVLGEQHDVSFYKP